MEREVLEVAIDAAQEEILALVRVAPKGSLGPASLTAYELDTLAALVAAAKASSSLTELTASLKTCKQLLRHYKITLNRDSSVYELR